MICECSYTVSHLLRIHSYFLFSGPMQQVFNRASRFDTFTLLLALRLPSCMIRSRLAQWYQAVFCNMIVSLLEDMVRSVGMLVPCFRFDEPRLFNECASTINIHYVLCPISSVLLMLGTSFENVIFRYEPAPVLSIK